MLIKGFLGVSLIDYPGKIASVIFLAGCNFRCPFCHNPELVTGFRQLPVFSQEEILEKLKERQNFIDGVVLTGGEPLIYRTLKEFLGRIKKETNLFVKVDTNGYFPEYLEALMQEGLVDYVAMDIKTSPDKYYQAAGRKLDFSRIERSIKLLLNSSIPYEFRTTVVPGLVDEKDLHSIASLLSGARKYVLQQFRNLKTLSVRFKRIQPYSLQRLYDMENFLKGFSIAEVEVRAG